MLNSVAVHALPSIKAQSIFTLEISAIAAPTAAIADSKVCSYSVLLRVPEFNYQLESDWPIYRQLQFLWAGRKAYTEGSLPLIIDWIKNKNPDFSPYNMDCNL